MPEGSGSVVVGEPERLCYRRGQVELTFVRWERIRVGLKLEVLLQAQENVSVVPAELAQAAEKGL